MDPTTWATVAAAVAALLSTALLVTAARRRGRGRAETAEDVGTEISPEAAEALASVGSDAPVEGPAEGSESVSIRALRAQVRTLEEALGQVVEPTPAATLATLDDPEAGPEAAYRRQVRLTLRALARHTTDDESPHRTMSRVAAAVGRLDAPDALARPLLPLLDGPTYGPRLTGLASPAQATAPRLATVRPAPAVVAPAVVAPALVVPAPVAPAPVAHASPAPLAPANHHAAPDPVETDDVADVADAFQGPEIVLPVPPPAPVPVKRRRRLRRQAA